VFHVVLVLLLAVLLWLVWQLVHSSPRSLSLLLPPQLTAVLGATLLVIGLFAAYLSAYVLQDGGAMLSSLFKAFLGLWWLLAASSGLRGSDRDEEMLRRVFFMMIMLTVTLLGVLYVGDRRGVAMLSLVLITGGFWVTTSYMRYLDRGR